MLTRPSIASQGLEASDAGMREGGRGGKGAAEAVKCKEGSVLRESELSRPPRPQNLLTKDAGLLHTDSDTPATLFLLLVLSFLHFFPHILFLVHFKTS